MNIYEKTAKGMREAIENPGKYPEVKPEDDTLPKNKSGQAETAVTQKEKIPTEKHWLGEWEAKHE